MVVDAVGLKDEGSVGSFETADGSSGVHGACLADSHVK